MNDQKYLRQSGIVTPSTCEGKEIVLVGAGGIGSVTALALAKLGDFNIQVFDNDMVSEWNQPSTLYGPKDVNQFKVVSLANIIEELTGAQLKGLHSKLPLEDGSIPGSEILIVATDNMASRKCMWEYFKRESSVRFFVDARMGGELAIVYSIEKSFYVAPECLKPAALDRWVVSSEDQKFYEEMLHSDEEADPQSCTERAIIYNTFMIAALIARSVKGYCMQSEKAPRELVFDIRNFVFQVRE